MSRFRSWTIVFIAALAQVVMAGSLCAAPITSGLQLWLDGADLNGDGNYTNNPSNGTSVGTGGNNWVDKSGNGNTAAYYAGTAPTYLNSAQNGLGAVHWGNSAGVLQTPNITAGPFSYFVAYNTSSASSGILYERGPDANTFFGEYLTTRIGSTSHVNRSNTSGVYSSYNNTNANWGTGSFLVAEQLFDGTHVGHVNYKDGTLQTMTVAGAGAVNATPVTNPLYIGARANTLAPLLNNDMGELIMYNRVLNTAERIITENYLASKFNLATAVDRYDGDTAGHSNFDFNVFGVGRRDDGTNPGSVTSATEGAYGITVNSGLDNDDFVMAGTSTLDGLQGPLYVDTSNLEGDESITLAFDVNKLGLSGSGFKLMYSATNPNGLVFTGLLGEPVNGIVSFNLLGSQLLDGFYGLEGYFITPEPSSVILFGVTCCGAFAFLVRKQRRPRGPHA